MGQYTRWLKWVGLLLIVLIGDAYGKDAQLSDETDEKKQWIGAYYSLGRHSHIWSSSVYTGYKNWTLGLFYERETDGWIPFPLDTERTWRGEFHFKKLWGTIPLDEDQIPPEDRDGGPYSTTLDHYQFTLQLVRRWVFLPDYWIRPNLHLGFGLSMLNKTIIEDGTLHSFNFVGGGGVEADLSDRWSIFADLRWEHFSNGGQIYLTNGAVIGPESLNWLFGLRFRL